MAMSTMSSMDVLKTRMEALKAQDDERQDLFAGLFLKIDELSEALVDAQREVRDKKIVIDHVRKQEDESEKKIKDLEFEKKQHGFVLALIDGDCMPFLDDLVRQGEEGGRKAASLLVQAVREDARHWDPDAAPHLEVLVRVYANVRGLSKVYKDGDMLPGQITLNDFIRGFNKGDVRCDYIDAGNGKECSDEKVKANFKLFLTNVHCRQVLLGGTADGGYARLIEQYIEDEPARQRITLINGPTPAAELARIAPLFRDTTLKSVFRAEKIHNVKRKVSFHVTPPRTPVGDYATIASKAPTALAIAPNLHPTSPPSGVLRNAKGQRVDPPLSYFPQDFFRLKHRKLCNTYYLLGACPYVEWKGKCDHDHGEPISEREKYALRAVARLKACPQRNSCNDSRCINGHHCTRPDCSDPKNCRFATEMHIVDMKVV